MTDQISFPPFHDPVPEEVERRKQHLLSEITRRRRLTPPSFTVPRPRFALLAGTVVALAAGATALSASFGGSVAEAAPLLMQTPSGKTVSLPASSLPAATTEIVGGTESDQELMRTIVAGMQPTVIEKIEIVRTGNDVALHFTFTGASGQALWEDWLVADAFRDRARAAGDDVSVSIYDGDAFGAKPPPGLRVIPPGQPGDAAAARQLFEYAAAQADVSFGSLTIYQPDGAAVAATFTSNDPASFLVHQVPAFLNALGGNPGGLDGTYLSLLDGSGHTVWEAFWNNRSSQGGAGSIPALAGCNPVPNWGGLTAPPCPAS